MGTVSSFEKAKLKKVLHDKFDDLFDEAIDRKSVRTAKTVLKYTLVLGVGILIGFKLK